jgi:hypothetical protein
MMPHRAVSGNEIVVANGATRNATIGRYEIRSCLKSGILSGFLDIVHAVASIPDFWFDWEKRYEVG